MDTKGEQLILAEARLGVLDGEYTVLERCRGNELCRTWSTSGSSTIIPSSAKAFYVVAGDFVTTEDGTGIVHMAPAYGEDDYQIAEEV